MTELNITSSEANQRLNKYLMKYLDKAPSSFIYKMLRKKNITLNNKKAVGDEILEKGDCVKLFLSDETIEKFRNTQNLTKHTKNEKNQSSNCNDLIVLYQDKDIISVHKPAGLLSQKANKDDISINEVIIDYCIANNLIDVSGSINFKPSICNRLDRNTSGIILAGLSLHGSQYLSKILKEHSCDKYYFTIVNGIFTKKEHCKAYIIKDSEANVSDIISTLDYNNLDLSAKKNYNYIETIFEPLSSSGNYSLLKVKLITGKSHQIRAHLKHLGYPIIGDTKYGSLSTNRYFRDKYKLKHHLLHAGSITFDNLTITDSLPDIFKDICKGEKININSIK